MAAMISNQNVANHPSLLTYDAHRENSAAVFMALKNVRLTCHSFANSSKRYEDARDAGLPTDREVGAPCTLGAEARSANSGAAVAERDVSCGTTRRKLQNAIGEKHGRKD
jgi:hypothetical protein